MGMLPLVVFPFSIGYMKKLERRQQVPIVAAVLLLLAMFVLTDWQGVGWTRPLPRLLFLLLMISALTLGISAGSGGASLLPMVSGASFLTCWACCPRCGCYSSPQLSMD
jgi:peptidoglycan/LPS O-acetylase OafA/YrhL